MRWMMLVLALVAGALSACQIGPSHGVYGRAAVPPPAAQKAPAR